MESKPVSYRDAGVDTHAGQAFVQRIKSAVQSTYNAGVIQDKAGFAGLFDASSFKDMQAPTLVSSTDGVGTKLKLAQLFDRHDTVGVDLVAMCANDLLVTSARALFFLDYIATGKLNQERMTAIVEGVARGCRQAHCALLGGETAEHPDTMAPDDYDLAGFVVGVVDRAKIINGATVQAGDAVIGLPSSGVHSNGMSLVRRLFLKDGVQAPDSAADRDFLLNEILLRPTIIYEDAVRPLLDQGAPIRAMAHITGGGFYENAPRMLSESLAIEFDAAAWRPPELFQRIAERGPVAPREMFSVFNMGIGLMMIVPAAEADAVLQGARAAFRPFEAQAQGQSPALIGRVLPRTGDAVVIRF